MSNPTNLASFYEANPKARAWAALDKATNAQKKITPGAIRLKRNQFSRKRVVIIGAGISGLTTAYELLSQESGVEVTIVEAQNRTGGRCLSLRTGDTLTEDINSDLFDSPRGETQTVRFKHPLGDEQPYLNAGPGRIPSHHKHLLNYLRDFGVAVEVYVMNSESNLVHKKDWVFGDDAMVYRQLNHNIRGWIAQMVHNNADTLLKESSLNIPDKIQETRATQLRQLMISFGELAPNGKYVPTAGQDGFENARARAGFDVLPAIEAGAVADAINLDTLLQSKFWDDTRFYQPSDFLWQPTLFQPVGGMDQVQRAFAREVAARGGTIHLNCPVRSIDWDAEKSEFVIHAEQIGTDETIEHRADYCFSNMAIPFLSRILSPELQMKKGESGFNTDFKRALHAVYDHQFENSDPGARYLAPTTKVGWQADRRLWQGDDLQLEDCDECGESYYAISNSEKGVVPIFGGISWTDNPIQQIWYPSTGYHDKLGILTGAYNFGKHALSFGGMSVQQRLDTAKKGAAVFGQAFADGLNEGVTIAWQNIPYIKGGWAQWNDLKDAETHFNVLTQGTGVRKPSGEMSKPIFFIIGDQLSSLPGWQEGAIAAALNAISRMARPDLEIPHLASLPDTRLMVEGL